MAFFMEIKRPTVESLPAKYWVIRIGIMNEYGYYGMCQIHWARIKTIVKFILIIKTPEFINTRSPEKCWQYYFGLVPLGINMGGYPLFKKHPSGKSHFVCCEKVIWFWCFWPDGSGAGFKGMQDTNGSGKETYCAESMEEMLYSYVNTYIYTHIY